MAYYTYSREHGPGNIVIHGDIVLANCQAGGHFILREVFGKVLGEQLLSKEVYEDEKLFRRVGDNELFHPGDIFLFGPKKLKDTKNLHWAVYCGLDTETGEPSLIHLNKIDGTWGIWRLSRFATEPRYETLFAVKRVLLPVEV